MGLTYSLSLQLNASSIRSVFLARPKSGHDFLLRLYLGVPFKKHGCTSGLQLQQNGHQKLDAGRKFVDVRLSKLVYVSSVGMCLCESIG